MREPIILTIVDNEIVDITDKVVFIRGQYCYYDSTGEQKVVTTPIYDLSKLTVAQLQLIGNTKSVQTVKEPIFTTKFTRADVLVNLKVRVKNHGLGVVNTTMLRPAGDFRFSSVNGGSN